MEPVTHFMTGACLARAGFNRKAAYATLAMTLAAEAPDLDTLWAFDGPVASFQHHRGWTHTFLGLPLEAAVLLGIIWLFHRWRSRRPSARPPIAPIRWGLLYIFILIGLLSHLLLDWTNNYGVRPFFPFNPRWYAGSFVFIFEPVLFLILLTALIAPSLFGLIGSEIGARKPAFRGQNWAIFALLAMAALWTLRFVQHQKALQLAQNNDYNGAPVLRTAADPHPINPFRWQTVVETPTFYQVSTADTLNNTISSSSEADTVFKPPTTLATLAAKQSWLGEIYLDWSQWPVVTETGIDQDGIATVTFRDLRFLDDTPLLAPGRPTPLSGTVYVNSDRHIVRMEVGDRIQH
ncbi:MAG: metal-dependent hydrolase [Edaphobacter sp.]